MIVAHFNHRLRGLDSDTDAMSVQSMADDLGLEFQLATGDGSRSDEQTARNQRREFLGQVARRNGARYIALGHTLNDNVETALYRLFRGTGPAGLQGITPFRPFSDEPEGMDLVVARPLLTVSSELVRDALKSIGIQWREDSSNQSLKYRRNWIRHQLIPAVQEQFPDVVSAVGRAIDGQRQWASCLEPLIHQWEQAHLVSQKPLTLRQVDASDQADPGVTMAQQAIVIESLRRQWLTLGWPLQAMGQPQWNQLYEILCGEGPSDWTLPGAIQVRRLNGQIVFQRVTR